MLQLTCSYADMQFITAVYLVERKKHGKAGLDIIYDSARVLMRGMDFSENYCGAERNVERW